MKVMVSCNYERSRIKTSISSTLSLWFQKKKVKQNIPFSACSNKHELSSPLFHQENHCQSVIPYHFSPWPPSVNSQQGCPTSSRTSSVHSPHSFQNDLSNSNMSYSLTTVPFLPTHRGFIFKLFI